jgi:hypothetical protein
MLQHLSLQECNASGICSSANWSPMGDEDKQLIVDLSAWSGLSASQVAKKAGLSPSTLTRPLQEPWKFRLSAPTIDKLRVTFPNFPLFARTADLPPASLERAYMPVDIMPTYGGMGGGGSGEGDVERAMIPRYLIEDVFRGRPDNFVVIRTRGDSMAPDFQHDDELLCDKRDTSPVQPGPFALWDAEDEAYVIKNVEKLAGGLFRIFSTNPKYTPREINREETHIIGRPVWFARRL